MSRNLDRLPRRDVLKKMAAALAGLLPTSLPVAAEGIHLSLSCEPHNDLYRLLVSSGFSCARYATADEATAHAARSSGVLILADAYPRKATQLDPAVFKRAAQRSLRLYVEFPSFVPGIKLGLPQSAPLGKTGNLLDRVVVASSAFAPELEEMRILAVHDCRFLPVKLANADLVFARVAGFDTAVFGLPEKNVHPILFRLPGGQIVATTKLSNLITARYAPADAWRHVWRRILMWLCGGIEVPVRSWIPAAHPAFEEHQVLPDGSELSAFSRGVEWYINARLMVAPAWKAKVVAYRSIPGPHAGPEPSWPLGDGSDGILEGFSSNIEINGSQPVGWNLRSDCAAETSMAMALSGAAEGKSRNSKIAEHLNDFVFFNSPLGSGPRDDPKSSSFGLIGWSLPRAPGVYYGDDNARTLLGTMVAAGLLKTSRWDKRVLMALLANLRTTGKFGFRPNSLTEAVLQKLGWRHFYDWAGVNYHPHYEAYLWACFLRAYEKTRYTPFLERARTAIQMTMNAYPEQWRWTNGFQQERARMLLPLAWLLRIDDNAGHRAWLKRITKDLLALQDRSGAIGEEIGSIGKGEFGPPKSNDQYGTAEAPLLQRNGNPVCDLLYTVNFAFLGLHEAAAVTNDAFYRLAEDRVAQFLCRIQIRSESHRELGGGWYRAFDFSRWDYWASNSDWGWGAWSIETGWTQSWISSVLAMRHLKTSLWNLTGRSDWGSHLNQLLPVMFGDTSL